MVRKIRKTWFKIVSSLAGAIGLSTLLASCYGMPNIEYEPDMYGMPPCPIDHEDLAEGEACPDCGWTKADLVDEEPETSTGASESESESE